MLKMPLPRRGFEVSYQKEPANLISADIIVIEEVRTSSEIIEIGSEDALKIPSSKLEKTGYTDHVP